MNKEIPKFLMDKLNNQYSSEEISKVKEGLTKNKKTAFRINTIKTTKKSVIEVLKSSGIKFEEVPWNEDAITLDDADENMIRQLDIYENGEIYLQNPSAMIPAMVLSPKKKENILDMCAAPRTGKQPR